MAVPTPQPKGTLAQRAARDPALLKRVLGNPGLRYKLPASMLPIAQQRARATAQAAKARTSAEVALSDPTTPLSGSNLIGAAKSIVDRAYDPQLAEIGRQQATTQAQGTQAQGAVGSMYDTIAKYQTAALNQQNTQQAQGAQSVAGIYSGAAGQVDAAAEQQRAQAARDAQVRGTGLDGGSLADLASRVTTAKDNIAQRGQIAGDNMAANAQTNNAVLGGIGAATQQHRGEQQDAIGNQTRGKLDTLAGQRSVLQGNRGSDFVKQILGLRTQAANEYITESGLGIKQQAAKDSQTSKDQAVNKYGYTNADWTKLGTQGRQKVITDTYKSQHPPAKGDGGKINQYGYSNADWAKMTPAGRQKIMAKVKADGRAPGKGGKSPYAPIATQVATKDSLSYAVPLAQQYVSAGSDTASIRSALRNGVPADKQAGTPAIKPVPAGLVNAILDVAVLGGISPENVVALKRRGIKVGRLGYKMLTPAEADAARKKYEAKRKALGTVMNAAGQ